MRLPSLFVVVLAVSGISLAQVVPIGPEFQVNTYTTFARTDPALGPDGAGDFVVVWTSQGSSGPTELCVRGQRFASTGAALGAEFQVNTYTTGPQYAPPVGPDGAGGFLVAWTSEGPDTSSMPSRGSATTARARR